MSGLGDAWLSRWAFAASRGTPDGSYHWFAFALQIMTDDTPYASAKSEQGIILAIARGRLPANISELHLPHNVNTALTLCWNPKPDSRPSMARIISIITRPRHLWDSVIPDLLPGEQFVKGDEWSAQYLTESVSAFDMDSTLVMGYEFICITIPGCMHI